MEGKERERVREKEREGKKKNTSRPTVFGIRKVVEKLTTTFTGAR